MSHTLPYPQLQEPEDSYSSRLIQALFADPKLLPWRNTCEASFDPDLESMKLRVLSLAMERESVRARVLLLFQQLCRPGCCAPGQSESTKSVILAVSIEPSGSFLISVEEDE